MLKDQLRRRRAQDLGSYIEALTSATPAPTPFLMPAEFYTSLFASAVLQQQQQQQQCEASRWYPQTPSPTPPVKLTATGTPPPAHLSSNLLFSAVCVAAVESAKRSQLKPQDVAETKAQQNVLEKVSNVGLAEHVSMKVVCKVEQLFFFY